MIPILYPANEAAKGASAFTSNGLGGLGDAISCTVIEERNGTYELEMAYPVEGLRFNDLANDRLILAKPNETSAKQIFRIYQIEKPINGRVTVRAEHISYLLTKALCLPFEATGPNDAFQKITSNVQWNTSNTNFPSFPFTFWTDFVSTAPIKVTTPKSVRAILAGESGSIIDSIGKGEYEFDNFNVKFYNERGNDTGVTLRYGKNITDISDEDDITNAFTGILPYWTGSIESTSASPNSDGEVVTESVDTTIYITSEAQEAYANNHTTTNYLNGSSLWSDKVSNFAYPLAVVEDLSGDIDIPSYSRPEIEQSEGESDATFAARVIFARRAAEEAYRNTILTALTEKANDILEKNTSWKPSISLKVSFVALWNTEEYKDLAVLERVSLGDTITVYYPKLDISAKVRVIKTTYNVLLDRYEEIELGEAKGSAAGAINSSRSEAAEREAELLQKVASNRSDLQVAIEQATNLISGGLGGYVIINKNAAGKPNEILIMDSPSKQTAVNVIRMNMNGIGFSTNGYNGPFDTAWTIDGHFNADYITTGTLNANLIKAGIITDSNNTNWWNLDTGNFHLSALSDYQTTAQRDADLATINTQIQSARSYTDQEILALSTATSSQRDADMATISGQIQDAMDYTDQEIASVNQDIAAVAQDVTTLSNQTSSRFDVMSDNIASQIESTKVELTTRYILPQNAEDKLNYYYRFNNQAQYITKTTHNGRNCLCIDGTSLTAYSANWYMNWRITFDVAASATLSIDFELDSVAEDEDLTRQWFCALTYISKNDNIRYLAPGYMNLQVADGVQSVVTKDGSVVSKKDTVYTSTTTKVASTPDTQEDVRIYFVPGHKLYVYDCNLTITKEAYTDSVISSIDQKADSIELQVEQLSDNTKANFIHDDFETNTEGWWTGETTDIVSATTYNNEQCIQMDGTIAANDSPDLSTLSYHYILYRVDITQPGTYTYQFTYASDNAVPAGKTFAGWGYGINNPVEGGTPEIIFWMPSSYQFKTKAQAAGEAVVYTGQFTIPNETTLTISGTTYTVPTDIRVFKYRDTDIGPCALTMYLPRGGNSYIYDFSIYGSATDYARSVLSVARSEINAEVMRATNAESALDSRLTITETGLQTEVSQRQADTSSLSSRITQNANSIQSEVTARQADTTSLSSRITQNANNITLKVNKGDIASTINQTAQSVLINASKINLSGYVTVSSLGSGGSTTIDGSRITTGLISASRVAISDATNFSQLNDKTYSSYGFTQYTSGTDIWYQLTNSRRDYALSEKYTVNGAEKYRVKCTIFTNARGIIESGGSTVGYIGVGIGLFCGRGNGTWFSYPKTTMAKATSSSGTTLEINEIVTLHADTRKMSVYLHTEGWGSYSGTIRVKDLTVTRATTAELVVDGSITADKLAANSITAVKISTGAVENGKIKDGAISTAKIANSAVTTDKIPSSAITTVKIADNAITAGKIIANAVTADKIAANAVTAAKINASAVTADKIASNAVTAAKIAASAIEVGKIKDGAVTTAKIANSAVTTDKIPSSAITTVKIADGAISAGKIAANAVSAGKIAANAITADKINAGAVTAAKLAANAVTADKIAANAIDGKTITGGIFKSSGKTSLTDANDGVYISKDGMAFGKSKVFHVTSAGALTATSATITGKITASSGTIGSGATNKITIGTNATNASIYYGMSSLGNTSSNGFYIGTDGIALGKGKFKVTSAGALTATSASITGTISGSTITGGQITQNNTSTGKGPNGNANPSGTTASIKDGIVTCGRVTLNNGSSLYPDGNDVYGKNGIYTPGHFATGGVLWVGQNSEYRDYIAYFRGKVRAWDIYLDSSGKWLSQVGSGGGGDYSNDINALRDSINEIRSYLGMSVIL